MMFMEIALSNCLPHSGFAHSSTGPCSPRRESGRRSRGALRIFALSELSPSLRYFSASNDPGHSDPKCLQTIDLCTAIVVGATAISTRDIRTGFWGKWQDICHATLRCSAPRTMTRDPRIRAFLHCLEVAMWDGWFSLVIWLLRQDAAQAGPLRRGEGAKEKSVGGRTRCAPVR
jgi:hypothetical protein